VNSAATHNKLAELRLVAFDVDGVFTDGRFYLSDDGVESKAFNTQDGFGVRRLIDAGFEVAVISGRKSAAVAKRMAELGVRHVVLGTGDKVAAFDELLSGLGIDASECAYAGDDIPDLALLEKVGYSIAVANAVEEVRDFCDYTTMAAGGYGAVREVCDLVLAARPGTET
jgi:3-deoxy-D-manno-octulosonate 8-phosphate phosphatase (KDO 8-P phosphatase)